MYQLCLAGLRVAVKPSENTGFSRVYTSSLPAIDTNTQLICCNVAEIMEQQGRHTVGISKRTACCANQSFSSTHIPHLDLGGVNVGFSLALDDKQGLEASASSLK